MSTAKEIRAHIRKLPKGKPFTTSCFTAHGTRSSVDRALSRPRALLLTDTKLRDRAFHASSTKVKSNVSPAVCSFVPGKTGSSAQFFPVSRRWSVPLPRLTVRPSRYMALKLPIASGLSTQVPVMPVYHTSASSRSIRIANTMVRLIHTSNRRRLQFAGEAPGLALAALWYLGKDNVTRETITAIRAAIGEDEYERLRSADVPAWMTAVLAGQRQEFGLNLSPSVP